MTSIQLTALPDGPYRLKGDVTILDRDGELFPDRGSYLCRYGRSAGKPLCDRSHARAACTGDA